MDRQRGRDQYGALRGFVHTIAMAALGLVMSASMMTTASARPLRLLALGDSLTAGYRLADKDAFPSVLQQALRDRGYDVDVVNAGVSGDTANDALDRLDWALNEPADAAIVEVGANDMLRGVDPRIPREAIAAILTKLRDKRVATLLAGMYAAPGLGKAYEAAFNAIYPDLSRQFGAPLYPFFLDGVVFQAGMQLDDGLHPSAAGVRVIVSRILPAVEALLAGLKKDAT